MIQIEFINNIDDNLIQIAMNGNTNGTGTDLTFEEIIQRCIILYQNNSSKFKQMYDYYIGDTDAMMNYKMITSRANNKVSVNFIKKFVKEETSYILSNKVTYLSKSGNDDLVNTINLNIAHWSEKHDQNLCKNALIYGSAFELYYIDKDGLFNIRILNPLNSYALIDSLNQIQLFLTFFKLPFDINQYLDVYNDTQIFHYKVVGTSLTQIGIDDHFFGSVPVGLCQIAEEKEYDTLFNDLKGLQDAYETNLSDISNELTDFRQAYLKIIGATIEDSDLNKMKELGAMQVPKDGDVQWLIKNINDNFIQNTLNTLEDKIYQISCHINSNEKMQSNLSGVTLRSRLISLENKCKLNMNAITDTIKTRLKFLFIYLNIKRNQTYDYRDVKVKYTVMIPSDDASMAQIITQLNEKLSTETGLAQLSFVDNVQEEMARIKAENEANDIGKNLLNSTGDINGQTV